MFFLTPSLILRVTGELGLPLGVELFGFTGASLGFPERLPESTGGQLGVTREPTGTYLTHA